MSVGNNWARVSMASPCPICHEPDWCSVSCDRTVVKCMRRAEGAFRTKTDKSGAEYYLQRLDGAAARGVAIPLPPRDANSGRADPDTLHRVYGALLAALPLSTAHRERCGIAVWPTQRLTAEDTAACRSRAAPAWPTSRMIGLATCYYACRASPSVNAMAVATSRSLARPGY
jgi:hypothetical protein